MKKQIWSIFGLAAFVIAPLFALAEEITLPRPDPTIAEFARGVKFTVNGYTGTEVLTNFPVLVRLSDDSPSGFHYSDFTRADYKDLCFVDMQTNGLPCEVDTWDANGESLVWVTLPSVTNGTEFVMWYHSSSPGSVICDKTAWGDYAGVWHMNETDDGAVTVVDATTNHLDAAATSESVAQPNGRIGGARIPTKDGSGKSTQRIEVNLNDNTKKAVVNNVNTDADHAFTVSMWVKPVKYSSFDGPNSAYLMSRKTADNQGYWAVQFHYDSTKKSVDYSWLRVWRNETADGSTTKVNFEDSVIPSEASSCYGNWYKFDVVYSGTTAYFYVNGGGAPNSCITNTSSKTPANGSNLLFLTGTSVGNKARPFRGDLDEFRLRAGAMSADWVKADYDTVDNASFLAAGTVQSVKVKEMPFAGFSRLDSGAAFVTFTSVITSLGDVEDGAESCDVYYKVWKSVETETNEWTLLRSGITAVNTVFTNSVTCLTPGTAYSWKLKAKNNLDDETEEIGSGSFTTSGAGVAGVGGETYRVQDDYVHRFTVDGETTSYTFTPPSYISALRALVVAGGGPGGYGQGGGGGAGGCVYDAALALSGGSTYTINVGTGGVASTSSTVYGLNGGDSSIALGETVVTNAVGGGAGGNYGSTNKRGQSGGSGGASSLNSASEGSVGGNPVAGQGFAGGRGMPHEGFLNGGGGGGAGEVGGDATTQGATLSAGGGGAGFYTDISGTWAYYAGGGGGGADVLAKGGKTGNGPGRGGDGGGGNGGSGTVAATAGQDDFGGGGGGGYVESVGGNGGSGVVIFRYAVQGTGNDMPQPAVSLTSAAYNGDTFTADVVYRVAWAGSGKDVADVAIAWGYSPDSLIHTNAAASGVIGIGTFSVPLIADQRTVYLRAVATNATGNTGVSTETRSIYVEQNDNAQEDDYSPVVANVGIVAVDSAYVVVTGVVTSVGQSEETCTVNLRMGTTENTLAVVASGRCAKDGVFALTNNALSASSTYLWQVVAVDDAGTSFATEPASVTTLGASFLNAATVTSTQREITLSGNLSVIGGGVTYVLVKWNDGEWETIGTFTPDSASGNFSTNFTTSNAWGEATAWAVMSSNAYVTAAGELTGAFAVSTPSEATGTSGSITPVDAATYIWKADNGDWNGNWNDSAHWSSDKVDCVGYPNDANAIASFLGCTLANPVAVNVNGKYTVKKIQFFDADPADLSFVGTGTNTSSLASIDENLIVNEYMRDGSRLLVKDLKFTGNNKEWKLAQKKENTAANVSVVFSGAAVENVKALWFLVNESSLTFCDGSTVALTEKLSVGGTNTVVTIDDSTVTTPNVYTGDNRDSTGLKLRFAGAQPRLVATTNFQTYNRADEILLEFAVPVGGYSLPPIAKTGVAFATAINGQTPGHFKFAVAEDSPALKRSSEELSNMVIVQTENGFATDYINEHIGTVPEHNGTPCGEFKWGVEGTPLADGAALSTARQILLDLQGHVNGVLFLIY